MPTKVIHIWNTWKSVIGLQAKIKHLKTIKNEYGHTKESKDDKVILMNPYPSI